MRISASWSLAITAALVIPSGMLQGQPKPAFARHVLRFPYEFASVSSVDLNGNGLEDLIVVQAERLQREPRLFVSVFLQTPGGFESEGGVQPLPPGVALAGAGRFGGQPGLALLLPGEVQLWPWKASRFAAAEPWRQPVDSAFPVVAQEPVANIPWIAELNGDGEHELIVPRFDGIEIVQFGGGRSSSRGRLAVRPRTRFWRTLNYQVVAHDLPALFYRDLDGDGWKEVIAFSDGELWVFSPGGDGGAGSVPPLLYRDLQPPKVFDPKEPYDPPMRLVAAEDLNGDRILDLVIAKNAPTDSEFQSKSTTLVYFGKPAIGAPAFSDEADQVFPSEGFSLPIVLDLNANGRLDLIQVNVEVTFFNAVRAIVTRTVKADAGFYLMSDNGRYPDEADEVESYSVNFSLSRFGHQPIATWGDFNGDRLPDLLLSADKNKLGIHWGRAGAFWNTSPDVSITEDLPINQTRLLVQDLNGDQKHDLILTYVRDDNRQMPETLGTLTVLLSRAEASSK